MTNQHGTNAIFQEDNKAYILNELGTEAWIWVYLNEKTEAENRFYWSALISNTLVPESVKTNRWELRADGGYPALEIYEEDGTEHVEYLRFGTSKGVEPLVFLRHFHGVKPKYAEVSEEFRHLHNLYHDARNNKYIKILDDGTEDEVIRVTSNSVRIKLKYLKQFLAVKNMHLAIYYEIDRFSSLTLAEMDLLRSSDTTQVDKACFTFSIADYHTTGNKEHKSLSRLIGKKLIAGVPIEKSGFWPYGEEETEVYLEFVIGTDENGNEITYSCEPDRLDNLFGSNPDAPSYLSSVFFKREVLAKYYSNPDKYDVEDGYLRCGGLWGMNMDNNHPDYVIAYLGDLGGQLPESERPHWRQYNVLPEGGLSSVAFKRHILADFAEPTKSDLLFKLRYEVIQERWTSQFGWPLFLPLDPKDRHYFSALHIPTTNDQKEFDEQVLALVKVLIDSLNEEQLKAGIVHLLDSKRPVPKGIGKLELFLQAKGVTGYEDHIKFLRNLQDLRSKGSGHRKGTDYPEVAAVFQLDEKDPILVFDDILKNAIEVLLFLESELFASNAARRQDRT